MITETEPIIGSSENTGIVSRVLSWAARPVRGGRLGGTMALFLLLDILYMVLFGAVVFGVMGISVPDNVTFEMPYTAWYTIPVAMLIMALEEALFRLLPLRFAVRRWGVSTEVLLVAVVASILFGWWHGHPLNIAAHGVGGFFYSLLFLKAGGFSERYSRAFWVCFTLHLIFNTIMISLGYLAGNRTISVSLPF